MPTYQEWEDRQIAIESGDTYCHECGQLSDECFCTCPECGLVKCECSRDCDFPDDILFDYDEEDISHDPGGGVLQ